MQTIPAAIAKSLPPMEQGAPMMSQDVKPEGALNEASKKIAAATLQIVEQVQVVLRSGDESKRRALLKAIELLTSEFPPEPGSQNEGQPSDAVMQSIQPQPGATPPPGGDPSQMMPPPAMGGAPQPQAGA